MEPEIVIAEEVTDVSRELKKDDVIDIKFTTWNGSVRDSVSYCRNVAFISLIDTYCPTDPLFRCGSFMYLESIAQKSGGVRHRIFAVDLGETREVIISESVRIWRRVKR